MIQSVSVETKQEMAGEVSASPRPDFPRGLDLASRPPYPHRHSGPALVVGSAAVAYEDVEAARVLFPRAALMAVNRSAGHFEAEFIVAIDRRKASRWRDMQEQRYGRWHFTMHGGRFGANTCASYPWFDYWWPGLQTGGTSSWLGAKILAVIGFSPIVLCGVPLEPMPYLDGEDSWSDRTNIEDYRRPIRKDEWMKPVVYSMSGWTREWFGFPT